MLAAPFGDELLVKAGSIRGELAHDGLDRSGLGCDLGTPPVTLDFFPDEICADDAADDEGGGEDARRRLAVAVAEDDEAVFDRIDAGHVLY